MGRAMDGDDPLAELRRDYDAFRQERPSRRSSRRLTNDEKVRLLDAAMGVLGATSALVRVGEDILRERRDELASGEQRPPGAREPDDESGSKIDLSY